MKSIEMLAITINNICYKEAEMNRYEIIKDVKETLGVVPEWQESFPEPIWRPSGR